jgi:dipeptidyl aminopeptidase/acylaminoacyl peptidase
VHGGKDTNVPVGESRQMFEALQQLRRRVECLIFDDDGHAIVKRENRAVLVKTIGEWLMEAFASSPLE